ncbi:MAG: hypothetical protein AAF669_08575 [Pseudomonadota bacterium]
MQKHDIYAAQEDPTWALADPRAGYKMRSDKLKIMPDRYQANDCRKFQECLFVIDDFLSAEKLNKLQKNASMLAEKAGGWARSFDVTANNITASRRQMNQNDLLPTECSQLESAIDAVVPEVHQAISQLTHSEKIVKYNTWINTGSILADNQQEDFHFWHYDSDEYIESCLPGDWLRFPVWAAILYIRQPENLRHFTIFDDHRINQKIRSLTNRLVVFDPGYMHKVIGTRIADDSPDPRLVMVFNAWDYDAPDDAIDELP